MTRLRKVDPEVLEREYVYDAGNPPISFTALAAKHGLHRNTVAEKATKGRWYEKREEFRTQLGEKAVDMLGDQWVRFETALREKVMAIGLKYLDDYAKNLESGEVKTSTRDMLGVAAMLRVYLADANRAKVNGEEVLLDSNSTDLHPDIARRVLDRLDQDALRLGSGVLDDDGADGEPGPDPETPPAGIEESREN